MLANILQIVVILLALSALVVPVGAYITWIFTGERHLLFERLIYRVLGIDPAE